MRRLAWLLAFGFACGCGGGGGASTGAPAGTTSPADDTLTLKQALAPCSTQNVRDATSFLQSLGAASQGGDVQGFTVTGLDLGTLVADWSLDADQDGVAEARGTIQFLDANGQPTVPFDVAAYEAGTASLADLLAQVPDGTRALIHFELLAFVDGTGDLDVRFMSGQPSEASGDMALSDGPCASRAQFDDLLLPATRDGFPTGVLDVDVQSGPDHVVGTITMDGTRVAHLHGTVNGGAPQDATLDLATGELVMG